MSVPTPNIDSRTYDDIVTQTEKLVQSHSGSKWKPAGADEHLDAAGALIRIFSRMVEVAIHRLNRLPDKNFLAFLDLIGTQIQPPQPAKVPLTFLLSNGSPGDSFVPAGSRVAATLAEGESEEVLFETDRDLVVTKSQLKAVFVRDPDRDRYGDYPARATEEKVDSFAVFEGDRPIPHSLYLAHDDLFALPDSKTISFNVTLTSALEAQQFAHLPLCWSYWDGDTWRSLSSENLNSTCESERWTITITNCPIPTQKQIDGVKARWMRVQLGSSLLGKNHILTQLQSGQKVLDLDRPFYPFGDSTPTETFFYLCVDEAFQRSDYIIQFFFLLEQVGVASTLNFSLKWQYLVGSQWQELTETENEFIDNTQGFTQRGLVTFACPDDWKSAPLYNHKGRWLRLEIAEGSYTKPPKISAIQVWPSIEDSPSIQRISVGARLEQPNLLPTFGFANSTPLDLGKGFNPFGDRPRLNDAAYFALDPNADFAKLGTATVTVNVNLTDPPPNVVNPTSDLVVAWEVFTTNGWEELARSPEANSGSPLNFTASGAFILAIPSTTAPGVVNGETSYWLRGRIIRGNYGTATSVNQVTTYAILTSDAPEASSILNVSSVRGFMPGDPIWIALGSAQQESARIVNVRHQDNNGNPVQQLDILVEPENGNLVHNHSADTGIYLRQNVVSPPSVESLTFSYVYDTADDPADLTTCLSNNDFLYNDRTSAAKANSSLPSFQPFTPSQIPKPTLYMGFDRPFTNRPTTLYAQVDPPTYSKISSSQTRTNARLNWEYRTASGWSRLGVQDLTRAFAERGLLTFIGPKDFAEAREFDLDLYWLRATWEEGKFQVMPRLKRICTNTTWASQAITLHQETLGSGNGNPNQLFKTAQTPVLQGQTLEVLERVTREPEETGGDRQELDWVVWQSQPDFYASGPDDRHYVLDALTGEIRFGDGANGKVPPRGRNNVRMTYRTGGGQRGDRDVGTLIELKTAIPYIDAVTNDEVATGGADAETLDTAKVRGPKQLRHRGRAVTVEDFEDLAYLASPDVARAKAIQAHSATEAGQVGVIVVPRSTDPQPVPSVELLNRVEDYIRDRCVTTLDVWAAGPEWLKVTVTADIAPKSWPEATALDVKAIAALQEFLHPLTGGFEGRGWSFGREPQTSDLYRLLESLPGVGYVSTLSIDKDLRGDVLRSDRFLVYSGSHAIYLVEPEQGV